MRTGKLLLGIFKIMRYNYKEVLKLALYRRPSGLRILNRSFGNYYYVFSESPGCKIFPPVRISVISNLLIFVYYHYCIFPLFFKITESKVLSGTATCNGRRRQLKLKSERRSTIRESEGGKTLPQFSQDNRRMQELFRARHKFH